MGCQGYGMVHQGLGDFNVVNKTNFLPYYMDLRSSLMVLCQTTPGPLLCLVKLSMFNFRIMLAL
jgi:hypothetical protein